MRRLSRWQAEQQREAVADVYVEAYQRVHGEEFHDRQRFLDAFARDVQRPGFDMMVGSGSGGAESAGYAYGFLLDRAGEWWRGIGRDTPWDVEELTVSGQVFALAELMVAPAFRRDKVATRLLEQLLVRTDASLVTARVDPDNAAAVGALRSWGWVRLGAVTGTVSSVPSLGAGTATEIWGRALKG